ncbi:DUF4358 domain-containing protein [Ruminococcus sp.]|jgi:hypothetical protein|uniref:DUF4358 domain-containing protein n=1 Tax=Ruminococcus sp. TaxID=41978 RepID=UPI00292EDA2E|nr:DUF4358 domain-containing protein [uncultured Ruminococcus sp.]
MKRIISLIAVVAVLAAVLCACGSSAKPLGDVFSELKTTYNVTDMVEFKDASDLNRFYGIAAEDVKEFAGGINNSGVNMEEIVLILASDKDAAGRIAEALNNRLTSKLNETKNYNPEQYAIVENATVDTDNNYVSLIISENCGKMKADYKKAIGVAK